MTAAIGLSTTLPQVQSQAANGNGCTADVVLSCHSYTQYQAQDLRTLHRPLLHTAMHCCFVMLRSMQTGADEGPAPAEWQCMDSLCRRWPGRPSMGRGLHWCCPAPRVFWRTTTSRSREAARLASCSRLQHWVRPLPGQTTHLFGPLTLTDQSVPAGEITSRQGQRSPEKVWLCAGSMAGGFFATSISGKMPAGIEASHVPLQHAYHVHMYSYTDMPIHRLAWLWMTSVIQCQYKLGKADDSKYHLCRSH